MDTAVKRLYEGMFLVDSGQAASDWKGINKAIEKILKKAGAKIVSQKKWDDRRLAYEVQGKDRGTYILVYFDCDTAKIASIERDVQLSEKIVRVLILRTDKMSQDDLNKETPAMVAEREQTDQESEQPTADDSETEQDLEEDIEETDLEDMPEDEDQDKE